MKMPKKKLIHGQRRIGTAIGSYYIKLNLFSFTRSYSKVHYNLQFINNTF